MEFDVSTYTSAAVVILAIIGVAALALLSTTLQAVFTASVYRYAVTGEGGPMFPAATMQDAFRTTD